MAPKNIERKKNQTLTYLWLYLAERWFKRLCDCDEYIIRPIVDDDNIAIYFCLVISLPVIKKEKELSS